MTWRTLILDLSGLAGLASLSVGLWWVYPPAALIVSGAILLALAVFGASRGDS